MNLGLYQQLIYILLSSEETQPGGRHCIAHNAFLRAHLKGLRKLLPPQKNSQACCGVGGKKKKTNKKNWRTYDNKLTNGGCNRTWACEPLVLQQNYNKHIQLWHNRVKTRGDKKANSEKQSFPWHIWCLTSKQSQDSLYKTVNSSCCIFTTRKTFMWPALPIVPKVIC